MKVLLRNFQPSDAASVNEVALSAFDELRPHYSDWASFSKIIGNIAALANSGELIVALADNQVAGAVTYVGPGKPKKGFFPDEWPILRMLVVAPKYRGLGLGRELTKECIRRALRDRAEVIALHTSPIMNVALPMYQRMGFTFERDAPSIFGVPYGIYVKKLRSNDQPGTSDVHR